MVLLGGSKDYNLFQIPDLEEHLRLLAAAGGNYIRNSMSGRDPGDVQPYARARDGHYDLEVWNDEYWRRFDELLWLTYEMDIIVQIEVWDRFDFSRDQWKTTPFNPENNINYTYEQSGFAESYSDHPGENQQPFFYTTPRQRNNTVVLRHQQRFVDEMLRHSLPYPNVLYCIDNETSGDEAWSAYWADYIHSRARAAGVTVHVTEMWDDWDVRAAQHRRTFDYPTRYDFVDVSQNNHQRGEKHWRDFQWARQYLDTYPRPMNAVKIYGADGGATPPPNQPWWRGWRRRIGIKPTTDTSTDYGDTQEGTARWWRHLIGGGAAMRFHRPPAGIGLNTVAQQHIRSARMFLQEFDIVRATPDTEHTLLADRHADEAYVTRIDGEAYAVYFPNAGDVRLSVERAQAYSVTWLDILASRWGAASFVNNQRSIRLKTPGSGQWLALVKKNRAAENDRDVREVTSFRRR
ncbi:MAG: hypothetical protein ACJ8LN_16460 [Sulfurifustis sp.]